MSLIGENWHKEMGYELQMTDELLLTENDANSSSEMEEVNVYRRAGIVDGKGGVRVDPKANSTRAKGSTVFTRLIETLLKSLK